MYIFFTKLIENIHLFQKVEDDIQSKQQNQTTNQGEEGDQLWHMLSL